ncbi:MAG: hypothetical protein ABJH20_15685 [Rhizobiaceae bacterium]
MVNIDLFSPFLSNFDHIEAQPHWESAKGRVIDVSIYLTEIFAFYPPHNKPIRQDANIDVQDMEHLTGT